MVDVSDRPTLGPYVLTRELTPADAFWGEPGGADLGLGDRAERAATLIEVKPEAESPSPRRNAGEPWRTDDVRVSSSEGVRRSPPMRFLALHLSAQSSHLAYRFDPISTPGEREHFRCVFEAAAQLLHPHLLPLERLIFDGQGSPWVITPFAGDVDGVRTLSRLLHEKRGQMHAGEVDRAMVQLLGTLRWVHTRPIEPGPMSVQHHGPVSPRQILVDRHGSLLLELFGMSRLLGATSGGRMTGHSELIRDEVRSIVEIGYRLLTGLRAEEPVIPAGRLVRELDPRWDRWFEHGLNPMRGFESAEEALAGLPSRQPPLPTPPGPIVKVRGVLNWLRAPKQG